MRQRRMLDGRVIPPEPSALMGVTVAASLSLGVAGAVAWLWTADWRWMLTGLLVMLVALFVGYGVQTWLKK